MIYGWAMGASVGYIASWARARGASVGYMVELGTRGASVGYIAIWARG